MRQTLIKKKTEEREKRKKKKGEREAAPGAVRKYVSAALRRRRIASTSQGQWLGSLGGDANPPCRAARCIRGCLPRPLASGSRRAVVVPARDGERLRRRRAAHRQ